MEEALREAAIDAWREGFARSVAEKRIRAKELLAGEQRRFQELEGELARRLDMLAKQLAQGEAQHHKVVADAQARSAACDERSRSQDERQRELAGREQRVTHMLDDLQRRLSDLQSRQHEVEAASKELHIRQTECAQREADLAKHQAELLVRTEDVVRRKQELDQQQHHLDQAHKSHQSEAEALKEKQFECQQLQKDWERLKERVQERELETQKQRRHIAQQLRKRKSEVSKEAELHRAEALASSAGEELQLQMRLSELQAKYEKLRDEVASSGQQTAEANQRVVLLQKQLEAKQKELDTRHKEAGQNLAAREQFEALRRQFDTDKQKLHGEGQKKYDEARKQLEAAQGELAKRRAEAEVKAGELSRLQAELAKRATDLETRTAEVQKSQSELDRVRREMQQQLDTLKSDAAKSQDDQVRSLQGQLDRLRQEYDNDHQLAQQQAGESQRRIKQLEGELTAAKSGGASADESSRELARLRSHNKQLDDALTEALERSRTSAVVSETNQEFEDLRRRFELAVEDVRELKNKNAELSDQLSKAKASGGRIESGAMDWEAQKRRMLEQMEADFDEGDAKQKADKLTVEATIKATDKLLTEKDQELAELKRLLENQSQNVGEVAVGAAAIAAALDGDAIVRQERENLQQLQAKLREEHKKAEVDCSLERAKIARERSELEEKMRQFAADKASHGAVEPGVGGKGKKGGGKWLERLGLGGDKSK